MPGHFAERHNLIIILALGESVIALGVGAEVELDATVAVVGALGIGLAAALWWIYFDVVAIVTARRLEQAGPGRASATAWPATPTRTSTSRWSRASCCSALGLRGGRPARR